MTRPAFAPITSNVQGWDAPLNDDINILRLGPWPVYQALDSGLDSLSDLEFTYPAANFDRCLVWVNDATKGWRLAVSVPVSGTPTWLWLPKAALDVLLTDSSGGTSGGNTIAACTDVATLANAVATLAAKINSLL